ncbi:MAG: hypothetical protein ICV52_03520, partial [Microcoleus sp. C1-bin4]|nr:hypothetical protein [Microcoleus sp. C1-bin4]
MASPSIKIKILLIERGETVAGLARKFKCLRQELSMVVNGARFYPHLQDALASHFNTTVEELFD